ncbi:hypothetical protein BJV78DRAFT_946049 [Lactifluus subvellereus]|nr:hypothetical protein BJV78DRAFT_946049 [Lactifluus subvellereus]
MGHRDGRRTSFRAVLARTMLNEHTRRLGPEYGPLCFDQGQSPTLKPITFCAATPIQDENVAHVVACFFPHSPGHPRKIRWPCLASLTSSTASPCATSPSLEDRALSKPELPSQQVCANSRPLSTDPWAHSRSHSSHSGARSHPSHPHLATPPTT